MYTRVHEAWQRCAVWLLPSSSPSDAAAARGGDNDNDHATAAQRVQVLFDVYIVQPYSDAARHYHTLTHLDDMFALLAQYRDDCAATATAASASQQPLAQLVLDLAILFHDAVYDPRAGDNEEQSAQWLQRFLHEARAWCTSSSLRVASSQQQHAQLLWCDERAAARVEQTAMAYIRHTANHLAAAPAAVAGCVDDGDARDADATASLSLLLDLDLAVLGQSAAAYAHYAACIRREYASYSDVDYCAGRAAFLAKLLQHARWYKTDYFHARLELQARHNVASELHELRAQHRALVATAHDAAATAADTTQ